MGERLVGGCDRLGERGLERRFDDPAPNFGASLGQRADVVDVESRKARCDRAREVVVGEEFAEGRGGRREAARYPNAGATELPDHLAERCVLAADLVDVGHAQALEGNDAGGLAHRRKG